MILRWGPRSSGGVVRAGYGGWSLTLGLPPTISYQDPDHGDGMSIVTWRLLHARRLIGEAMRLRAAERAHAIETAAWRLGLSRAPGESDQALRDRCLLAYRRAAERVADAYVFTDPERPQNAPTKEPPHA